MRRLELLRRVVVSAVAAGWTGGVSLAQTPLGTSFTYQGRLADGGSAVSGAFDFQFALYGAPTGGAPLGAVADRPAVAVANGLFTVPLDFGPGAFAGDARWLEIRVRPAGGPLHTVLGARQPLTATPYALAATRADTLDGLNSTQLVRSDQDARIGGSLTLDATAAANAVYSETGITRTEPGLAAFTIANGGTGLFDAAQLLLDAGAAGPAYSFVGDTDTGVSRTASDRLDLVAGGAVVAQARPTGFETRLAAAGVALRADAGGFPASDGVLGVAGSANGRGLVAQQTGTGPALVASSAQGDHLRASVSPGPGDLDPALRITNAGHLMSDGVFAFGAAVDSASAPPAFNAIGDPSAAPDFGAQDASDLYVGGTVGTPTLRANRVIVGDATATNAVLGDDTLFVRSGWGILPAGAAFPQLVFVDETTIRLGTEFESKVGIGRIPQVNELEVDGTASKAVAGGWLANSDRRLKTDIQDLDDPLAVVRRLRPVSFRYDAGFLDRHPNVKDVRYHNFVAQEFQEVFPDSVQDDGEGFLQIDTHPAAIYAVAAVQELDRALAAKDARIAALEQRLARLEAALTAAAPRP